MISRRQFLKFGLAGGAASLLAGQAQKIDQLFSKGSAYRVSAKAPAMPTAPLVPQVPLPGSAIPQFVQLLPALDLVPDTGAEIDLHLREFKANILPPGFLLPNGAVYSGTTVWGYLQGTAASRSSYLGPVIIAKRGSPTTIRFSNELPTTWDTQMLAYKNSVDQTLHWADPLGDPMMPNMCTHMPSQQPMGDCGLQYQGPIPAAVHLHGGEVPPELDGGPDSWFTNYWTDQNNALRDPIYGGGYYTAAGAAPNESIITYPNQQEPGLIWFHDHTLGATRLNVYAGLAGGYVIEDALNGVTLSGLPEVIPLVIQDRMFDANGELFFPAGVPNIPNPEHPLWVPEFVGDTIVVNGAAWPFMNVQRKRYTFAIINGSNARTYEMSLTNQTTNANGPAMWQIGTDGGFLDLPVKIDPNAAVLPRLVMMPGERAIVVIDFGNLPVGSNLLLKNVAKTPYPNGAAPKGNTTGRIMQFRVVAGGPAVDTSYNPAALQPLRGTGAVTSLPALVRLVNPVAGTPAAGVVPVLKRRLTLNEVMGMPTVVDGVAYPGGPLEVLVNNTKWAGEYQTGMSSWAPAPNLPVPGGTHILDIMHNHLSEFPVEGTTEIWEMVNLTADAHPMHTHLTQFQLLNRQNFDVKKYLAAYGLAFPGGGFDMMTGQPYPAGVYIPGFGTPLLYDQLIGGAVGGNPDVTPFLKGPIKVPNANEAGWKDTIFTPPGMVTRFVVRFAPIEKPLKDPGLYYPFEPGPADGYAYVWHCHIVDHEDNEMMRPYRVNSLAVTRSFVRGEHY